MSALVDVVRPAPVHLFARLRKIEEHDDGTLEVAGFASTEAVDRQGETVLASAIKAALPDFLEGGGGPLREMHGLSAAGTVTDAKIDAENRTLIKATVIDPVAIKKVRKGVYRGFSLGGKVLGRDAKNEKVITRISLLEISLVDRPANPEAVFGLWKADGGRLGHLGLDKAPDALTKLEATADQLEIRLEQLAAEWASVKAVIEKTGAVAMTADEAQGDALATAFDEKLRHCEAALANRELIFAEIRLAQTRVAAIAAAWESDQRQFLRLKH